MFRLVCLIFIFLAGCGNVVGPNPVLTKSVTNADFAYMLPRGMVAVTVFGDEHGIGVTFDPAEIHKDSGVGPLYVDLKHSVFNKEIIEIKTGDTPGFLSLVSSDTKTKILDISTEAAKSITKLSLQNAKQGFFSSKIVIGAPFLFDPYNRDERIAAVKSICALVVYGYETSNAAKALPANRFINACNDLENPRMHLTLRGDQILNDNFSKMNSDIRNLCSDGICARQMTTQILDLKIDETIYLSHSIEIPTKEVTSIPITSSVLADRKTVVTISDGILKEFKVEKESELLTIVKVPGAVIGGIAAGVVEQLDTEKNILDKEKSVIEGKKALFESEKSFHEAKIESGQKGSNSSFANQSRTIYMLHVDLDTSIKSAKKKNPGPQLPINIGSSNNSGDSVNHPTNVSPPSDGNSVKPQG